MSKGVLVFARNNNTVDYVKQAYFLAKQVKKYLQLPTTIVTDSGDYLQLSFPDYETVFDRVINIVWNKKDLSKDTTLSKTENHTFKRYHDGTLVEKKLEFKNETRTLAYDVSPYDETLLLDSDIVVNNDLYKWCFTQPNNFLIYKTAYDLAGFRDYREFEYISDSSIDFYWATCVFFRKTESNKIFFDLVQHIQENWTHYKNVYQLNRVVYRNDHAFSIAIHIMNGFQSGTMFAKEMPGKLFYTTDKDILHKIDNDEMLFLLEKQSHRGEYTAARFKHYNIHVMNKFSLNRCIDEVLDV